MKREIKDGWPNEAAHGRWDSRPPQKAPVPCSRAYWRVSLWAFHLDYLGLVLYSKGEKANQGRGTLTTCHRRFPNLIASFNNPLWDQAHFTAEGTEVEKG